jgi:hypothetical protein
MWGGYGSPPRAGGFGSSTSLNGFGSANSLAGLGSWESRQWGGSQASTAWSGGSSRGVSPARLETRAFVDLDEAQPESLDPRVDVVGGSEEQRASVEERHAESRAKDRPSLATLTTSLSADLRALANENTPRPVAASLPMSHSLAPTKKPVRSAHTAGSGLRRAQNQHQDIAHPGHLPREHSHLHPLNPAVPRPPSPQPNSHLCAEDVKLRLIRPLGVGAFSCVWLAEDAQGSLAAGGDRRGHSTSEAKRRRDRRMHGLRPANGRVNGGEKVNGDASAVKTLEDTNMTGEEKKDLNNTRVVSGDFARGRDIERQQSPLLIEPSPVSASNSTVAGGASGRLVAVKMMDRALCDVNDRTRISFVREVEVLRVSLL